MKTTYFAPTLLLALACSGHPDEGTPLSPGAGVEEVPGQGTAVQEYKARPIMGGTLLVAGDGRTAIASDPDRDAVFLADLQSHDVTPIQLEAGEVPGRVVEGNEQTVFVVLRNSGQLAHIDLSDKQLLRRIDVCNAPRGIAFDAGLGQLHVACRDGALLSFDAQTFEQLRQVYIAPDLRDVVVSGSTLVVTRFRSAEAIVVDSTGQISQRLLPPTPNGSPPSVAWRTQVASGGTVYMALQSTSTNQAVSTEPSGYGGGVEGCSSSIVTPMLTSATPVEGGQLIFGPRRTITGAAGPTDVAISRQGRIGMVIAGNAWSQSQGASSVLYMTGQEAQADVTPASPDICSQPQPGTSASAPEGEPVAIAFDGNDQGVVQSREPAALFLEDGTVITLSEESRASTGLALFHMNTGAGIACASCHPEGQEDAQVWNFAELGQRRTQMVAGGINARAPFHWDGDMADFKMLVDQVMVGRMSLDTRPNRLQMGAFVDWVDGIERPLPALADADAVARGKALYFDRSIGCNDCHTGPALTNNELVDVGTGGRFVVPTLIGIGSRAPYIHNGCAETLRARFDAACGGGDKHGQTSHLSDAELDDLTAYLKSL